MLKKNISWIIFTLMLCLGLSSFAFANEAEAEDERLISLPAPNKEGGKALMQCLNERRVSRVFSDTALSKEELSDLLWATYGINRDDGKRTVPTARNRQNLNVYVYMQKAFWIYNAETHALHRILDHDMGSTLKGSLTLVIAAEDAPYVEMSAGAMFQNAGLYAASAGFDNLVKINGVKEVQEVIAPYLPSKYTVRILQSISKK